MSVIHKIGIFTGREKVYNKFVLKTLFEKPNPMKGWDIAKEVYNCLTENNSLPKRWKGLHWYSITQKIYSVLIRKNGRLGDLRKKGYVGGIKEGNSTVWYLTAKGAIATLILDKKLIGEVSELAKNHDHIQSLHNYTELLKKKGALSKLAAFGLIVNLDSNQFISYYEKFAKKFSTIDGLRSYLSTVESLIKDGLDLDSIRIDTLILLMASSEKTQEWLNNILEGEQ